MRQHFLWIPAMAPKIDLLFSPNWTDYELLDSGEGQKLELFGPSLLDRMNFRVGKDESKKVLQFLTIETVK